MMREMRTGVFYYRKRSISVKTEKLFSLKKDLFLLRKNE